MTTDAYSSNQLLFAFGLTALAGLSTGIGSALAFFTRRTYPSFLSWSLGFSGGVMVYVSFAEILRKAEDALTTDFGEDVGGWATAAGFFGGMLLIAVIDRLVPSFENPHEARRVEEMAGGDDDLRQKKLLRMGLFSALAIGIHNFPEGMATFTAALQDPHLAVSIAVAIAIHNIPEGVAVSVPIFYATGSRRRAFAYSFLSGLAEPAGALLGYLLLLALFTPRVFGFVFAGVAGIMVFISLDELLPTAREYGKSHQVIYGVIAGMAVMALSLLLF